MTLVAAPGPFVPLHYFFASSAPQYTAGTISASGAKVGFIFPIPFGMASARTFRFRLGNVTTGQTLKGGLYNLDASGDPDTSSPYGGMVAGTVAVADSDDNVEKVITLGTDATCTPGDIVAFVIEFDSTVGNLNINTSIASALIKFPYTDLHNGTSWTKSQGGLAPFALADALGVYWPILGAAPYTAGLTTSAHQVDTAGTDEYALRFQNPFPTRVVGVAALITTTAGGDFEVILYDGTTVVGTARAIDGDFVGNAGVRIAYYPLKAATPGDLVIPANTVRRLSLRPTTANNLTIYRGTVGTAAAMAALPGGADWFLSTRLNQGAWDDSLTTQRPFYWPVFDQFDDGAGGGGGGFQPSLRAGMM